MHFADVVNSKRKQNGHHILADSTRGSDFHSHIRLFRAMLVYYVTGITYPGFLLGF